MNNNQNPLNYNPNPVPTNPEPVNNDGFMNQQQVILGNISNQSYQDTLGDINTVPETPVTQEYPSNNQYINPNPQTDYIANNNQFINDLNVDGAYNNMNNDSYVAPEFNNPPEYINDEKVRENIEGTKKNTSYGRGIRIK